MVVLLGLMTAALLFFLGVLIIISNLARLIGVVVMLVAIFPLVAIGYVGIFVAGISSAALFQWWGSENAGWALFGGGCIGLMTSIALIAAVINELRHRARDVIQAFRKKGLD